MLLAKAFLILVVGLVVENNSCGDSSSSFFTLFILDTVPIFFAADLNFLRCVFVSLTLASSWFAVTYDTVTLL